MSDQDPNGPGDPAGRPPQPSTPPSGGQPPPPPPYSRPPEQPPFGQPPSQGQPPPYGQPPQYGQPPFSQSPPQYGSGAPEYGAPPPQYGSQPPYGDPPPAFGTPPQYGQPAYGQSPYTPQPGQPPADAPGPYGAATAKPNNYLPMSIAAAVLGFFSCIGLGLGIAAIVFANRVNRFWPAGDRVAAQACAARAKSFATIGLIVDAVGLLVGVIVQSRAHR